MAKTIKENIKVNKGKEDLEFEDFDFALDDFDEFGENEAGRKPSKKKLAKAMMKKVADGATGELKSQFVRKAMPEGFESDYRTVKEMHDYTTDMVKEAVGEIKESVASILPDNIKNKLGIQKKEKYKALDERTMREAAIKNSIDGLFNGKAFDEALTNKIRDSEVKASGIAVDKVQVDLLNSMNNATIRTSNFLLSVGGEYFRKSLELQYRSYYLQTDILKSMNIYYKGFSTQFDSIIKNTGLPEYVKITNSERVENQFKEKMSQGVYNRAFTNNAYIQRIKTNLENKVKGYVNDIKSLADTIATTKETAESFGADAKTTAIEALGSVAGSVGASQASKKFLPKIRERIESNKYARGTSDTLKNVARNSSTVVEGIRSRLDRMYDEEKDYKFKGNAKRGAINFARGILSLGDSPSVNNNFVKNRIDSMKQPAVFDKNVYRNLTEGIPMYLSKILREVAEVNQKYSIVNADKVGRFERTESKIYNLQDRKLSTKSEYAKSINKNLKETNKRDSDYERTTQELKRRAIRNLSTNKEVNLTRINHLEKGETQEALNEYLDFMRRRPNVKKDYKELFIDATDMEKANPEIARYLKDKPDLRRALESLKVAATEGEDREKKMLVEGFDDSLTNAETDYPIVGIKELFLRTGQLGRSRVILKLTNEEATQISMGFSAYVYEKRRPIPPTKDGLISAFGYMSNEGYELVEPKIRIFIRSVDVLNKSGSAIAKQSFFTFVGAVNNELQGRILSVGDGKDKVKEIFDDIVDIAPFLFENSKLSVNNLMTYSLDEKGEINRVSNDRIESLKNINFGDAQRDRTTVAEKNVSSKKTLEEFKDKFKGGIDDISKGLVDVSSYIYNRSEETLKRNLGSINDTLSTLSVQTKQLLEHTPEKALTRTRASIQRLQSGINNAHKNIMESRLEELAKLEEVKEAMIANGDKGVPEINEKIQEFLKENRKIDTQFKELKSSMTRIRSYLSSNIQMKNRPTKDTVLKFKDMLSEEVTKLKEIMKEQGN